MATKRPGALTTQHGISAQIRKIFREARNNELTPNNAKTFVWILKTLADQMVTAQSLEELENRLEELEVQMKNG